VGGLSPHAPGGFCARGVTVHNRSFVHILALLYIHCLRGAIQLGFAVDSFTPHHQPGTHHVGQICLYEVAEGGTISVLPDFRAQWAD
jgi:hypothetical protein